MLVCPFKQVFRVYEALRLVSRAEHDGVQLAPVLGSRAHERVTGQVRHARLDADSGIVHVEEAVGRLQLHRFLAAVAVDGYRARSAADYFADEIVRHRALRDFRLVSSGAVQRTRVRVVIEAMRVLINRVGAADLLGLPVHGGNKRVDRIVSERGVARDHLGADGFGERPR